MSRRELETVTRAAIGLTAGLAAFASAAFAAESGDTLLRTVLASPGGLVQHISALTREPAVMQVAALTLASLAFGAISLRALMAARVRVRSAGAGRSPHPRRRAGELG